ncbi:MAG: hypothetical protein IJA60_05960 [Clostridia bacterium]|nr:hypothetical protein [Clostridia bacterium]
MTLAGAICVFFLVIKGYKLKKWYDCFYVEFGENWGGVNLGMFFITDRNSSVHTKNHEHGHAVQNCILGLFMPFLVSIPSAVRYWYRRVKKPNTAYDSVWFEKWASDIGEKWVK